MTYEGLTLSGAAVDQDTVQKFLRLDREQVQLDVLLLCQTAAMNYILDYTGLTEEEVAGHEDLAIAFLVLVQDMYDNRTLHPDTKYANSANRVVTGILDLHRRNLV